MKTLLQILAPVLSGAAMLIAILVVVSSCVYMSLKSEIGPLDTGTTLMDEAKAMIRVPNLEEAVAQIRLPDVAMEDLRMFAEIGEADQQFLLGALLCYGEGGPQDYVEGIEWYRKAAEQGHESAQHLLASIYFVGDNVPKDDAEAAKWYSMAAEQRNGAAQAVLSMMYHYGWGVPVDMDEARKWYREADLAFAE